MGELQGIKSEVINLWKKDLASVAEPETVKIVSGELNCDLYRGIKDDILRCMVDFKAKFEFIAGPIISLEDNTGSNAVLELTDNPLLELWISPNRLLSHYRIFGPRFLYIEDYHEALNPERKGEYVRDLIPISKYSYDFDNIRSALKMHTYNDKCPCLIKAKKSEIVELKKHVGELYDFMLADEIKIVLDSIRPIDKTHPSENKTRIRQ